MNRLRLCSLVLIVCAIFCANVSVSLGQSNNNWTGLGNPSDNWNVDDNWNFARVPLADSNDHALISNGDTVNVIDTPPQPGAAILNGSSTLNIQSGGNLTIFRNGTTSGELSISNGAVHVFGGGQVTAHRISLANVGTLILEGNASVTSMDTSNLNGLTRIIGPNVQFNVDELSLGSTSRFEPVITGTSHSVISSSGIIRIRGTLRPHIQSEISGVGDEWNLLDGSIIVGSFDNIDTSLAPLPAGLRFAVTTRSAGSTNGRLSVLSVEQELTIEVNRDTGAVSLQNLGPGGLSIDQYSISSPVGAIDPSEFTSSLQDDGFDNGAWMEVDQSTGVVSESNAGGFSTISGASSNLLGNLYNPLPAISEFAQPVPEDLSFTYHLQEGGEFNGSVEYVGQGTVNNVLLTVDTNSGDAEFRNDSQFSIQIDTYTVRSASESLLTTWNSLFDQSDGQWVEANPTASGVSELNPTSTKALGPGESFSLQGLFETAGGEQDLQVEFRVPDMGLIQGVVRYVALGPIGLIGDYNGDGVVNAADYTVWRDTLGQTIVPPGSGADGDGDGVIGPADYDVWRANYGAALTSGGSTLATVPEPGTPWLLITMLGLVGSFRRRVQD